jgi:hypothetical protein
MNEIDLTPKPMRKIDRFFTVCTLRLFTTKSLIKAIKTRDEITELMKRELNRRLREVE